MRTRRLVPARRRAGMIAGLAGALALALTACGGSGGGEAAGSAPEELVIPIMFAQTGPAGVYADSQLKGAQLAADTVNAQGGVNGTLKIRLVPTDTQADPQKAVTAFSRLGTSEKFSSLITSFSGQTQALLPLAAQKDVLMINVGAQSDDLRGKKPNLYSIVPTNLDETKALSDHLVAQGYRSAAILSTDDASGKNAGDDYEKNYAAAGGTIVGRETAPAAATDFRSQLTKLRGANPDVLLVSSLAGGAKNIIEQVQQLGWKVPMGATSAVDTPSVLTSPAAEGLNFSTFFRNTDEFTKAYTDKYGAAPNNVGAGTFYDGILALSSAAKIAMDKGYSFDAEGLSKAMDEVTVHSAFGGDPGFGTEGVIARTVSIGTVAGAKVQYAS